MLGINGRKYYRAVADKLYPLKKLKIKDKGDPWVSPGIIEILHDKDRLRKKDREKGRLGKS